MSYQQEDFSDMLFAWPAVEGRITHLYELDPTHVATQPTALIRNKAHQPTPVSRSTVPFCAMTDTTVTTVLLELDPTHCHTC